jgi:glycosyltransferase involved in cell wall biosynthesis
LKICLISDWYLPRIGGLELQMRDLAVELKRAGHTVEVVCSTPGPSELDGIRIHRLSESVLPRLATVWKPGEVDRVASLFRRGRYDVVHCHTAFSPLSLIGAKVADMLGIPTVLTEHSVLKGAGGRMLAAVNRFAAWTRWPDVLTAVSSYVADEMHRVSRRPVEILPNGVRLDEWDLPNDDRGVTTVATVMRFTPRKRPLDVVRAIPRVHAAVPESMRPRFVMVGDGPEMEKVQREADRLGVRAYLDLPGWQQRAEVKQILARASLFVLPTSKEALSIATLEALAAGLPAVAMNHGGVGDIVTHGKEGFLAADYDAWVEHIVALCRDEALRHRMANATRAAAARFSWPRILERHLEIYELAMDRRLGSRRVAVPADAAA